MKGSKKSIVELIAKIIFLVCAVVAIAAVLSITVYMIIKGTPALERVGVTDLLFKTVWAPTANPASYGILYIILTSIVGTAAAVLIGVPVGLMTAVFITEVANKKACSSCTACSGAPCSNPVRNLRSPRYDAFEPAYVPN